MCEYSHNNADIPVQYIHNSSGVCIYLHTVRGNIKYIQIQLGVQVIHNMLNKSAIDEETLYDKTCLSYSHFHLLFSSLLYKH